MELDWSEQSPHIRSLYRPWQPGDGYEEAEIEAAEARLGFRLPAALRKFYQAWGKRRDLTRTHNSLLGAERLGTEADALIICVENQACWYWAVPLSAVDQDDPPVVWAFAESGQSAQDEWIALPWKPSHPHLSVFLDDLAYLHAFLGGSIHGGFFRSPPVPLQEHQVAWLESHWNKVSVAPMGVNLIPEPEVDWSGLARYVRDGQALYWWGPGCSVVAREAKVLDEIAQRFQLTWTRRW